MTRALILGVTLAFLAVACTYDNGDARRVVDVPTADCGSSPPAQSTIDVDRQIEVDAGQGAGLFIEYATGGHWQLSTSCDTLKTGQRCQWDVVVTPAQGSSLSNVVGSDLEPDDGVRPYPDDPTSYQLVAWTDSDLDGFAFDTDPGVVVRVDALLDGSCALPYVFWVGDGALHPGAPSNPIDLVPSAD